MRCGLVAGCARFYSQENTMMLSCPTISYLLPGLTAVVVKTQDTNDVDIRTRTTHPLFAFLIPWESFQDLSWKGNQMTKDMARLRVLERQRMGQQPAASWTLQQPSAASLTSLRLSFLLAVPARRVCDGTTTRTPVGGRGSAVQVSFCVFVFILLRAGMFVSNVNKESKHKNREIILYCSSQHRSAQKFQMVRVFVFWKD